MKDAYAMEEFEELHGCVSCIFFVNPFRAENKNNNLCYHQCFHCYNRWTGEFNLFRLGFVNTPRPDRGLTDAEFEKEIEDAENFVYEVPLEEIKRILEEDHVGNVKDSDDCPECYADQ